MPSTSHARVGVCLCLLSIIGCSGGASDRPKVVPVSGKVTWKGKPVAGARVTFIKEGAPRYGEGETDAQGIYRLTTFDKGDGAIPGMHAITVLKPVAATAAKPISPTGDDYAKAMQAVQAPPSTHVESELPAKYADPKTSGLSRTVKDGGPNLIDLELTE